MNRRQGRIGRCLLWGVALMVLSSCSAPLTPRPRPGSPLGAEPSPGPDPASLEGLRDDLPVLDKTASLDDYLAYAALNNPGLEAAFFRWKAALERIPQVRSLPDPRFTYTYFIRQIETRVGSQRQKFALAQTFPWFGKLRLKGDAAAEAAEAKRQQYEALKLKLFYQVKDAYYEFHYLARAVTITAENIELLKFLETIARSHFAAGITANADVVRAQVELGKLEDRLQSLRDLSDPVSARLNAVLNRAPDAPIYVSTEASGDSITGLTEALDTAVLPDVSGSEEKADSRPDRKAETEKNTKQVAAARKEQKPPPSTAAPEPPSRASAEPAPVRQADAASEDLLGLSDDEVLTLFKTNNPELKAAGSMADMEHTGRALARKKYFPDLTLGFEIADTGEALNRNTPESGKDPVAAMVSFNVPIWYGKYRAGEREALARFQAAVKAQRDRENRLVSDTKMALYRYRDGQRRVDLFRDTLMPKAKQNLEVNFYNYQTGIGSFLELVDSLRTLLEFSLAYERAHADRAQRLAELEMLVGSNLTRPPVEAGEANPAVSPENPDQEKTAPPRGGMEHATP